MGTTPHRFRFILPSNDLHVSNALASGDHFNQWDLSLKAGRECRLCPRRHFNLWHPRRRVLAKNHLGNLERILIPLAQD